MTELSQVLNFYIRTKVFLGIRNHTLHSFFNTDPCIIHSDNFYEVLKEANNFFDKLKKTRNICYYNSPVYTTCTSIIINDKNEDQKYYLAHQRTPVDNSKIISEYVGHTITSYRDVKCWYLNLKLKIHLLSIRFCVDIYPLINNIFYPVLTNIIIDYIKIPNSNRGLGKILKRLFKNTNETNVKSNKICQIIINYCCPHFRCLKK